jgi:hypothetical protein
MTVMACDRCDRVYVIDEGSPLCPCPKCLGQTRWATREEVMAHVRRPDKQKEGHTRFLLPPPQWGELRDLSLEVRQTAREVVEESRRAREARQGQREQRNK